jgi:hypothetical protein
MKQQEFIGIVGHRLDGRKRQKRLWNNSKAFTFA